MRWSKSTIVLLTLGMVVILGIHDASAQCAMCSLTAQNATENGNVQGNGLNNGILFLLAMPYLAVAVIGTLWYYRYRSKKNVQPQQEI